MRIIPTILGKEWRFSGAAHSWSFEMVPDRHGDSGVPFSLLIEDQGLVEVDLSAILDPCTLIGMCWGLGYVILSKVVPCPLPLLFHSQHAQVPSSIWFPFIFCF